MVFIAPILVLLGLFFTACDNKDSQPPEVVLPDSDSDSRTDEDSGTGDSSDDTEISTETVSDEDSQAETDTETTGGTDSQSDIVLDTDTFGPNVSLLSPTEPAEGDFSSEAIITADRIKVSCRVVASSTSPSVNRSSVRVFAQRGDLRREVVAAPSTVDDIYTANLYLGDFSGGEVEVGCQAEDLSEPPALGSDRITTFVDTGPEIEVLSPEEGSFHGGEFELVFRVRAASVAPDDPWGQPDFNSITAFIGSADITPLLQNTPSGSGLFRAAINFNDPVFDPPIDGDNSILIYAANQRPTTPTVKEVLVHFTADSRGPLIDVTSPTSGELVGGIFSITASVTDLADVDPKSVVASVAGVYELPLVLLSGSRFSANFDSRVLPDNLVFPTIVVRAQDTLGNQRSYGFVVSLDNEPPIMSLDPPDVRESIYSIKNGRTECSWKFDPLGGYDPAGLDPFSGDSADDGQSVPQLVEVRGRIEDLGNSAPSNSGVEIPRAGVDPSSVQLFILDDEDGALLVDTNDDGYCDDINPLMIPSSAPSTGNEAVVINLVPLPSAGISDFRPVPEPPTSAQPAFDTAVGAPESICYSGIAENTPKPLCGTSPGTRIIDGIFSIAPYSATQCFGNPLDSLASGLSDGWVCLALRAVDQVGNIGISAPMRLCLNSDGNAVDCGSWGTIDTSGLPDCTGTYDADLLLTDPNRDCVLREADLPLPPSSPRSWLFEDYPSLQLIPQQ